MEVTRVRNRKIFDKGGQDFYELILLPAQNVACARFCEPVRERCPIEGSGAQRGTIEAKFETKGKNLIETPTTILG